MTSGKEIITFQFGHYSNFIGAHWWNTQESTFQYNPTDKPSEINHDVLFREGQTSRREVTFTPRLLLVDLAGSLRHLSQAGELYDRPDDPTYNLVEWPEAGVQVIENPKESKNKYLADLDGEAGKSGGDKDAAAYNLDNEVHYWSDYLRTRYHPRSVTTVKEYEHGSETKAFDIFSYGTELWKTETFQESFTDRIRNYAEECDNMQGFHLLLDGTDGFAGLGTSAIKYLGDEYSTKNVLAFASIPSATPNATPLQDCIRTMNLALSFQSLAEHSSVFVPLCTSSTGWNTPGPPTKFPYLQYDEQLPYHSSALLAAAIDTVTLRYRLRTDEQPSSLREMTDSLSYLGRTAAAGSLGLPFPMRPSAALFDTLEKMDQPLWQSLTPSCPLDDDHMWIQSVTLRGIPHGRLRSAQPTGRVVGYQGHNPAYSCTTRAEMMRLFLAFSCYSTASHVTTADAPLKTALPFPHIFTREVGQQGAIEATPRPTEIDVESVPAIAGLHSCQGLGSMLESLHTAVSKVPYKRRHQFRETGLEEDEYKECLEHLLQLRECYLEQMD